MTAGHLTLICILVLGTFGGCRAVPQITGTYDLRAVNGVALPVRAGWVAQGSSELTSGSMTLHPDGTYQYRLLFRVRSPSRGEYLDSTVHAGTYELRMSTLRLHTPGGDMAAQLAGPVMSLSMGGWTYLFRKAAPDGDPPADLSCVADQLGSPCRPYP